MKGPPNRRPLAEYPSSRRQRSLLVVAACFLVAGLAVFIVSRQRQHLVDVALPLLAIGVLGQLLFLLLRVRLRRRTKE